MLISWQADAGDAADEGQGSRGTRLARRLELECRACRNIGTAGRANNSRKKLAQQKLAPSLHNIHRPAFLLKTGRYTGSNFLTYCEVTVIIQVNAVENAQN